ncbi:hypothetical protein TNCV_3626371 [Trichonephila clavipes]|nr:hypothetical protein TNCV_3626371 [Trichonephila clavipes]
MSNPRWHPGGSAKHGYALPQMTMTDICYYALKRNRTVTPVELKSYLAASFGRLVSISTELQRLQERGLYARKPAICVPLTSCHRRKHLRPSIRQLDA